MTGDRAFLIKRAVLRAIADCGGRPVLEQAVIEVTSIKVDYLEPTTAEIDAALQQASQDRLCIALPTERGRKYSIADAGTHWLAANSR